MFEKNTKQVNLVISRMFAVCSVALLIMVVLSYLGVFEIEQEYILLVLLPGLLVTISPSILIRFLPPDFMKYYMLILASIFIGLIGTSNHVGVYITYALMPIFSCLYFEPGFTVKISTLSYIVMLGSIYVSSADRYEVVYLGQSRMQIFIAYALGFTIEYVIVSMILYYLVKRAKLMMEERYSAEEQNQMKSRFLSSVSHEIRTPMNAIIGMADVALRKDMDDDLRRSLTVIKSSSTGLLEIINDILDLSKIEAGKMDLVEIPYSTSGLMEDMQVIINARNADKHVPIYYHIQQDMPAALVGDSVRIKQVIFNFASNAIKYTSSGRIDISVSFTKPQDGCVEMTYSVKDTGQGIRSEDMDKLFSMYTRLDQEKNTGKEGTGIGLAISKYFADRMGGTINVQSEYGHGSTFTFTVKQRITDEISDTGHNTGNELNFTAPEARILLTDDNDINREVVVAMLEPLGIKIDQAHYGSDAVKKAAAAQYDLILMDSHMPVMNGEEATEYIRRTDGGINQNTPIIALTADTVTGVRERLISIGMNDYLMKPIDSDELFAMIRKYLPESKIVQK